MMKNLDTATSTPYLSSQTQLEEIIRQEIRANQNFISFARFMELALYHPTLGYYNQTSFQIGSAGDFTTASEISSLYAHCFAQQTLQILNALPQKNILELGAGSGQFAKDLLSVLAKQNQLPENYYIYEISPILREKQANYLLQTCPNVFARVQWLADLPEEFIGLVIANEVLDAIPTHCFAIQQNLCFERSVSWHHNQFSWELTHPLAKTAILKERYQLEDGYQSEINLAIQGFLQKLIKSIRQGMILFADYGYGEREYYHPQRTHGTLSCFHQHHYHQNPFIFVGQQDITSHVNFSQVIDIASEEGCLLEGYAAQGHFLFNCGLMEEARKHEQNLNEIEKFQLHQQIKKLTWPTEMGERIKIMGLSKNITLDLIGFQVYDRRREL